MTEILTNTPHWKQPNEELKAFFSLAPGLLCIAGFDGYFKQLSPQFFQVLGYGAEELLAQPLLNFIHPDDRPATEQVMGKLMMGEVISAFENRYCCAGGGYRTFAWSAIANSQTGLIYATAADITAQKQAEIHLRQEHDLSQAILDTVSALVVVLNRRGEIVRFNRTCETIAGYTIAEVIDKPIWDFLVPSDAVVDSRRVFQTLLQEKRPCQHENYWVSKSGQRHLIAWSNTVLAKDGEAVDYVIATGIDVTERRNDQLQLEQSGGQNQLLADMTQRIRQSLDLTQILQTTVTEVQTFLGCDRVFVLQEQTDGCGRLVAQRVSHEALATLADMFPASYLEPYRQAGIMAFDQLNTEASTENSTLIHSLTVTAQLVVPLIKQDQFWGLLIAHYCTQPHRWSPLETNLMKQLADQIGMAIDQAELLENLEGVVGQRTVALTEVNTQLLQEITERQYTEAALRESQQTLAGIVNLAGEAIISINQQQRIQMFNQAAERIFGYTATEVIGQSLGMLLPEAFRSIHRQHVLNFGESPKQSRHMGDHRAQVWGLNKRGESFPAEASISKNMTNDGLLFTVMLQDITARVEAESAIRRSEAQLRMTTNALPMLIAYIDADERYQFNNQTYEDWFDVKSTSLEGKRVEDVLGPNIYALIRPHLNQALNGQSVAFEAEFPHADRPNRWVSITYKADIQEGYVKGCFALTQDISDRKATERIKDEFVSIVSHELRTPLTSIHGSLKLLATGQLDAIQGKDLVNIALNNTERLTRLINDVLDLERIESGQIKMLRVRCGVAELLQKAARAMMPMAQTYNIDINVIPTDTTVYADPDHVEQTLTNLLSNAIKFSARGEPVILQALDRPNQVLFKVIDRGRGIPEDKLETIFERFQQVDTSDTRKHSGTGLGLAICREIIQRHGGRIWVTSLHGGGSTFCFTLPKTARPI